MSSYAPRATGPGDDADDWKTGFQIGSSSGMVCDTCRCLVRQDPGSARVHLEWHQKLDRLMERVLGER